MEGFGLGLMIVFAIAMSFVFGLAYGIKGLLKEDNKAVLWLLLASVSLVICFYLRA